MPPGLVTTIGLVLIKAYDAVKANDAVPNSEPVIPPSTLKLPDIVEPLTTFSEFKDASEPDTMTFFQFGIPMF
jgi:hypothetical protein